MKNVACKVVKMEEQVMETGSYFSGGNPPSSPSNSLSVCKTEASFLYVRRWILVTALKYSKEVHWGNWADNLLRLPRKSF